MLLQTRPCTTRRLGGAVCALPEQLLAKVGVGADAGHTRVGALAHEAAGSCKHTSSFCLPCACYTLVRDLPTPLLFVVMSMQRARSWFALPCWCTGVACVAFLASSPAAEVARQQARGAAPQLRLSVVVSVQKGARAVPHCVVPPVHWNRHVPWLQMVMAEGSVGHTFPQAPLQQQQCLSVHAQPIGLQLRVRDPPKAHHLRKKPEPSDWQAGLACSRDDSRAS